jgi:hypothetical protein
MTIENAEKIIKEKFPDKIPTGLRQYSNYYVFGLANSNDTSFGDMQYNSTFYTLNVNTGDIESHYIKEIINYI